MIIYYGKRVQKFQSYPKLDKYIDAIYYINLDIRPDRNDEFIQEIQKIDFPSDKIIRVPAIHKKSMGALGCTLSHIKTINMFIQSGKEHCIIFEDDFIFDPTNIDRVPEMISNLFTQVQFDICMLSGNIIKSHPTKYPFLKKVEEGLTSSGYILSKYFAPTLLKNLKESSHLLEHNYEEPELYALDAYWINLQPISNWYVFEPKLGLQRVSYSDIEKEVKDYNV